MRRNFASYKGFTNQGCSSTHALSLLLSQAYAGGCRSQTQEPKEAQHIQWQLRAEGGSLKWWWRWEDRQTCRHQGRPQSTQWGRPGQPWHGKREGWWWPGQRSSPVQTEHVPHRIAERRHRHTTFQRGSAEGARWSWCSPLWEGSALDATTVERTGGRGTWGEAPGRRSWQDHPYSCPSP